MEQNLRMKKTVYCITNNKGLFYNKSEGYRYNKPPYRSTFNTLFSLYRNKANAQKIADSLNINEENSWEVIPVEISID